MDQKTFERKRSAALKLLTDLHLSPPWICRLLWRLGVRIPPPLFMRFWSLALLQAAITALTWGAAMWVWSDLSQGGIKYPGVLIVVAAIVGAWTGVMIAAVILRKRRKNNLPLWSDI